MAFSEQDAVLVGLYVSFVSGRECTGFAQQIFFSFEPVDVLTDEQLSLSCTTSVIIVSQMAGVLRREQ